MSDSGLSGSEDAALLLTPGPLEAMASALQARMQIAFPATRYNFEFVPARMTIKEWDRIGGLAPFIGLGFKGITAKSEFDSTFEGVALWTIYVIAKNAGSTQARYLGDAQGAGILRLVQGAISMLNGFTLPAVGACQVMSAGNLWVDNWEAQGCMLAGIELAVQLSIDATDTLDFGDVPVLDEIDTTWTAPSGEVLITDVDTNVALEAA